MYFYYFFYLYLLFSNILSIHRHRVSRKHVQDSIRIDIAGKLLYIQNINQYKTAGWG